MRIQNTPSQSEIESGESKKGLWGPWASAGFGVVIGLAVIAAQLISGIAYTVVKIISGRPADFYEFIYSLTTDGLLLSIASIFSAVIGLVLIAVIIKIRGGYSVREYLGFRLLSKKVTLIMFALAGVFTLLSYLLSYIPGRSEGRFIEFLLEAYNTSVWPILFWLNIVLFVPALEEVFFRGFIFVSFRQSGIGITGTIIVTSLVWTLLHLGQYDFYDMASLFVFGIVLGVIRQKTNSMWGPFIPHSVNNFIAMVLMTLGPNNYTG
ncbi:lysostaphin resistance A-like protein [Chloroflexota bacterium]